jgi:hypothetical protein
MCTKCVNFSFFINLRVNSYAISLSSVWNVLELIRKVWHASYSRSLAIILVKSNTCGKSRQAISFKAMQTQTIERDWALDIFCSTF